LRKRYWTSYPEELSLHTLSKETRRSTDSKCRDFDEVSKKGLFFYPKSQRQNALVTFRPGDFDWFNQLFSCYSFESK
jgi:hypothetical protein